MIAADFYRIAESRLIPHLAPAGWERVDNVWFVKREPDGLSRLALDPKKSFERFAVLVSYDPQDLLDFISDLFAGETTNEQGGFLCGPYLTPAGVFRTRRDWPCRTKAQLDSSLATIIRAIDEVGYPWLQSLRDPMTLARQADPISALACGFAWERAKDIARANEKYLEMWNRLERALEMWPSAHPRLKNSFKRQYVYLARRLNRENELSQRFAAELKHEPSQA